jgi:hypothetical protein
MIYKLKRRGNGTVEEIIADLKRVAQLRGRTTVTHHEYSEDGEFTVSWVLKQCGSWNDALSTAGCTTSYRRWTSDDCLKGIKGVWDHIGRQPSYQDYESLAPGLGHPSITSVASHAGGWKVAMVAFKASSYAQDNESHIPDTRERSNSDSRIPGADSPRLPGRAPGCGAPSGYDGMPYEPINELGVLALFSMLADEMGIIIECVGSAFPDCTGKRRDLKTGRHVPVLIELEFRSSNFVRHGHAIGGCNMVVCWVHDWQKCPPGIEVVSLKEYLKERRHRPNSPAV